MLAATLLLAGLAGAPSIRADMVTDWNQILLRAEHVADVSPPAGGRAGALVQSAVFDAVNGIERRYQPIRVAPNAPRRASRAAAAARAAYTMLVHLYPAQKPDFDADLARSLASLLDEDEDGDDRAILRGVVWGQTVADAIWAWRSTDGFTSPPPPFLGGTDVGEWRPTPPDFSPGGAVQFATMPPWAMLSPSQFRPDGPPALTSDRYAADFNEVKCLGGAISALRTDDQLLAAKFWDSANGAYFWNSLALRLVAQRHASLLQNARLFALLNMAMADARIACWDAKYTYVFWRPITAIQLAATDGNPATLEDVSWTPSLGGTPNHPDYPSGHSTESGAAAAVLAHFFGEQTQFIMDSDWMPGVTRSFSSFSAATEEVNSARIIGGIHFRSACEDGRATGRKVSNYILRHAAQPVRGRASH